MVDLSVQRLLEQAIDSPLKLQLVLMFCDHPRLEATASHVAERAYRDIWSTSEALQELAEDGILVNTSTHTEPVYRYAPRPEYVEIIQRLYRAYNEPMERDDLQRLVREVGSIASFRRAAVNMPMLDQF
ncbi:MAG TPA: hypothetical protein VFT66_02935 [Roseiflexaceae bacterium]|jgi:hypothetical protein|nr:hypothetical protein [Roseiflexaceae bacterium]